MISIVFLISFCNEPLEEEGEEVWECVELAIEADVLVAEHSLPMLSSLLMPTVSIRPSYILYHLWILMHPLIEIYLLFPWEY